MPSVDSDDDIDVKGNKDTTGIATFNRVSNAAMANMRRQYQNDTSKTFTEKAFQTAFRNAFPEQYCVARKVSGKRKYFLCSANAGKPDPRCKYLQTYAPEGVLARNVISDLLGRNKGEYQKIPECYKQKWCRKCYQRYKYEFRKDSVGFARLRLDALRRQLVRFEDYVEGCRYTVQLTKAMQDRVSAYAEYHMLHPEIDPDEAGPICDEEDKAAAAAERAARKGQNQSKDAENQSDGAMSGGESDDEQGEGSNAKKSKKSKRSTSFNPTPELLTPVAMAFDIKHRFCSKTGTIGDKTLDDVEELIAYFEDCLDAGSITVVPAVEILFASKPVDEDKDEKGDRPSKKGPKRNHKEASSSHSDSDAPGAPDAPPRRSSKKAKSTAAPKPAATAKAANKGKARSKAQNATRTRTQRKATDAVQSTENGTADEVANLTESLGDIEMT